ncbi:MAG: GAF domain-containing sensor histidine kinase [Nonomuraea sp.]|nr:GAF domain-containing sensor histidine kinase [Nonomuraea sp.]
MLRVMGAAACAGALGLVAAAVLLGLANGSARTQSHLVFVAAFALVGGLIVWHQPRNGLGWLLLAGASSFALMEACGQYAILGLVTRPGTLPFAAAAGWPQSWLWVPGNAAFALVPLFFPEGRAPVRRRLLVVPPAVVAVLGALGPGGNGQVGGVREVVNPFGVAGLAGAVDVAETAFSLVLPVVFLAGAARLGWRAHARRGAESERVKWLVYAVGLAALVLAARLAAGLLDGRPGMWPADSLFWDLAAASAVSLIPAAIAVAVLRHRLFDIDLLINRTLVYAVLTTCVVGGYVAVVSYLGALLGESLPVSLAATGAVALTFAPLRARVQRGVDRLLYGYRDEPYALMTRLGRRLADDALVGQVLQTVAEALRLPYAAVELAGGDVVACGTPAGQGVRLPLAYHGEALGTLIVSPRPGDTGLTGVDRRLLADLAPQIAVALHLQRARERLVLAREEERRRLRHDLHDGLGPELAALTMRAETVQELMDDDPPQARRLLEEIVNGAESAVGEVRRLVEGLRPPALDTLGLVGALNAFVRAQAPGGPWVRMSAPDDLPPLPAAIEVAAYRIVTEALTNVRRHAGAATCGLRLAVEQGRLTVEVSDDGAGLAGRSPGVGLGSMRERAAELGGTFTVDSAPGEGTRVRAVLPVGA